MTIEAISDADLALVTGGARRAKIARPIVKRAARPLEEPTFHFSPTAEDLSALRTEISNAMRPF